MCQPILTISFGSDEAISLEEYAAKFMAYYNSLMEAPNLEESAKANLEKAKADLEAANKALEDANAKEEAAAKELESAKQNVAAIDEKIATAQENADKAAAVAEEKFNAVGNASIVVDELLGELSGKQNAVSNATDKLNDAQDKANAIQNELDSMTQTQDEKQNAFANAKAKYQNLLNTDEEVTIPSVSDAQTNLDTANSNLESIRNQKAAQELDVEKAEGDIKNINETLTECKQYVSEKEEALATAKKERDEIAKGSGVDLSELRDAADAKKAEYDKAVKDKEAASENYESAKKDLEEAETLNKELNSKLSDATDKVQTAQSAVDVATEKRDAAKAELDNLYGNNKDIEALRKAKEEAQAKEIEAKAAYDKAQEELDAADANLKEKHAELVKAVNFREKADQLSYEDALGNDITDEDFAYLNDYTALVKARKAEAEEAVAVYLKANKNLADAKTAYTEAKTANAAAIAELAIAQTEYDAELKAEEDKKKAEEEAKKKAEEEANKKANEDSNKKTDVEATEKTDDVKKTDLVKKTQTISTEKTESAKTQEASNAKESDAPKTGDFASPFTFALTGAAALYAGIVAYRKRRDA